MRFWYCVVFVFDGLDLVFGVFAFGGDGCWLNGAVGLWRIVCRLVWVFG